MQKLGIEKVPPIVTTAVLLDAKAYLGKGKAMQPARPSPPRTSRGCSRRRGSKSRGLLPGDVLYVYTGWGDNWKDPDTEKFYYTKGPGLAYDAAKYIEEKQSCCLRSIIRSPIRWRTASSRARQAAGRTPPDCRLRSTIMT